MITEKQMKNELFYSDFYDKSYLKIKPLKVTKRKGRHFWFDAAILDNSHADNKEFHTIGKVCSFSNSFIYQSLDELRGDVEPYKLQQIKALKSILGK